MKAFAHILYFIMQLTFGIGGGLLVGALTRWDWAWIGFIVGCVVWYGLVDRIEPR